MATKMRLFTFPITDDLDAGLRLMRERFGTPASETVRRALREYLQAHDALQPAAASAGSGRAKAKRRVKTKPKEGR